MPGNLSHLSFSDQFAHDFAETKADEVAHSDLALELEALTNDPDSVRVATMVKRLVDAGIDPVVVAKVCLIGDRPGSVMYEITTRTPALAAHERAATKALSAAIRGMDGAQACMHLTVAAVWLASQTHPNGQAVVDVTVLRALVQAAGPRPYVLDRMGMGAVDMADHASVARALIIEALADATQPTYAPLELTKPDVRVEALE